MKKDVLYLVLSISFIFSACKKDEGLNDSDHKSKFIKSMGTNAEGVDIKQTSDGGYILLGTIQGEGSKDVYLKKVDAFGNNQWSRTYDGPEGGYDELVAGLEILSNGEFAIVGTTTIKETVVIDTLGNTLEVNINSTFLLVTDYSGNAITKPFATYNSGKLLPINEKEDETGYGISIAPDGKIVLVSEKIVTQSATGQYKASYLRLIDPSTFQIINEAIAPPPKKPDDVTENTNIGFRDAIVHSGGSLIATGYTDEPQDEAQQNSALLSVLLTDDTAFSISKNIAYGGANMDIGNAIIENSNNDVMICGYTTTSSKQFYVLNFSSSELNKLTPETQWRFTGNHSGENEAFSIIEVNNGYVLAGYTELNSNRQFYIVKIDKTGSNLIWEKEYGYVDFDEAKAIVATDDNGLAVLGTSSDERGNKVMTLLKLDANGNLK